MPFYLVFRPAGPIALWSQRGSIRSKLSPQGGAVVGVFVDHRRRHGDNKREVARLASTIDQKAEV